MSKQDQIDAKCTGKAKFLSRTRAREVAKRMRKGGKRVAEYQCPECALWHVGTPNFAQSNEWEPRKYQDRPTPQRLKKGRFVLMKTERAGAKVAQDTISDPISYLETARLLSNDQVSAARSFEETWRAATEVPGIRDSCTFWEPKGYDSDDGPVAAIEARRALERHLGGYYAAIIRYVTIEQMPPRGAVQLGILREALNACARFFK